MENKSEIQVLNIHHCGCDAEGEVVIKNIEWDREIKCYYQGSDKQVLMALPSGSIRQVFLYMWLATINKSPLLLIGIISGLISVIPYAGFSLGFLAAIVTGLAHNTGYWPIIGIVIVFVIVQTLESFLITPKLVGNKVGLSSFATMLALIVGGNLLGLMGMLIAIPTAAIMKSVVVELKEEFHQLDWGS